jgi:O-antigen ligase
VEKYSGIKATFYWTAVLVPLSIAPGLLQDIFIAPKNTVMIAASLVLLGLHVGRFLMGLPIPEVSEIQAYPVVILVSLNVASLLYTTNPFYTRQAAVLNFGALTIIVLGSLYLDGRAAFGVMTAMALGGALVASAAFAQFSGWITLVEASRADRYVTATIGNANHLGAYLLFPIYAALGLNCTTRGRSWLGTGALVVLLIGALFISRARAAWLSLILSLPLFWYLLYKCRTIGAVDWALLHARKAAFLFLSVLVVMAALAAVAPTRYRYLSSLPEWTATESLKNRVRYARASWHLIRSAPFFGHGLWTFRNGVYEAQAQLADGDPGFFEGYENPSPRQVHNEYLEALNDGGVVAAGALLLLIVSVVRNGLRVVGRPEAAATDKCMVSAALSALFAVMIGAAFFFPFRLSITLAMTALTLAAIQGIYHHDAGKISIRLSPGKRSARLPIMALLLCLFTGVFWHAGWAPLQGELAFFRHHRALERGETGRARREIFRALAYEPQNTRYCVFAGQMLINSREFLPAAELFQRARCHFNGDVTAWSLDYLEGVLRLKMGSLFEARRALKSSLRFFPRYDLAQQQLQEVERIFETHDRMTIRLR